MLAARHLDRAAVDLGEQIVEVARDQIDDALLERLGGGQARRLAHRLLGPVGIAAAQLREAADIGDRVVDHLLLHPAVGGSRWGRSASGSLPSSPASPAPSGSSSGAGSGLSPGGNPPPPIWTGVAAPRLVPGAIAAIVAGVEDVGAGARGVRAARRDVAHHGHRRCEDLLDDDAHRIGEPARRVHAQDDDLGALIHRLVEAAPDIVGGGRPDRPLDVEHRDRVGSGLAHACEHNPEADPKADQSGRRRAEKSHGQAERCRARLGQGPGRRRTDAPGRLT